MRVQGHASGLYIYVLNVETLRQTFSFVSEGSEGSEGVEGVEGVKGSDF